MGSGASTEVARAYRLPPFMVNHYDAAAALRQKIGALAGRRETQARDVFDLHHLLAGGAPLPASTGRDAEVVDRRLPGEILRVRTHSSRRALPAS